MILLFFHSDGYIRFDVPPTGAEPAEPFVNEGLVSSLQQSVREALRGGNGVPGAKRGEKVAIFAESFFSQTIPVPSRQVSGLSVQETASVLAFEAEPFSGIAPDGALTSFVRVSNGANGDSSFDVAQLPKSVWKPLLSAVRAQRCTLLGAAGIPSKIARVPTAESLVEFAAEVAGGRVAMVSKGDGSEGNDIAVKTALGALILAALISGVWAWLSHSQWRETATIHAEMAQLNTERQNLDVQIRRVRRTALSNQAGNASNDSSPSSATERRRTSWATLLSGLSSAFDENVWLVSFVQMAPYDIRIEARANNADTQERAMAALSQQVSKGGWTLVEEVAEPVASGIFRFVFRAVRPEDTPSPMPQGNDYIYPEWL